MKRFHALAAAMTLTAGPALAHSGANGAAHVHPHGAEAWIALGLAAVIAAGFYMAWGRK